MMSRLTLASSLLLATISFLANEAHSHPSELSCDFDEGLEACGYEIPADIPNYAITAYLNETSSSILLGPARMGTGK